jgi:hypothetical protein
LPGSGQEWASSNSISRLGDRSLPVRHRFGSELPQKRSGDEMALQVEGVVDGGMEAEKPLCGAGRFKPLHFPLPPSNNLVRVLGAIVRAPPLLMTAGQTELPERGSIGGQLVGKELDA